MKIVVRLVSRYLVTRKIAILAVLSIAIGVMAMIVVIALMDGVMGFLVDHIRGTRADLVLRHRDAGTTLFDHWDAVSKMIEPEFARPDGPLLCMAPRQEARALVVPGDQPTADDQDRITGINIYGIDFEKESRLVPLQRMMSEVKAPDLRVAISERANPFATSGRPRILIGDVLAESLGVVAASAGLGNELVTVVIATPKRGPDGKPVFDDTRTAVVEVAGTFTTGRHDYDRAVAYMDRQDFLKLRFGDPRTSLDARTITARLKDGVRVQDAATLLRQRYPALSISTFEEVSAHELLTLRDQKKIMVVILFFIIAVATVAVLGIVYLMVVEKTREIGVLRSIGLSRWSLLMVFSIYGFAIGIAGAALGLGLGILVTKNLDAIVGWLSDLCGVKLLNVEIYRFEFIPTRIEPQSVVFVLAAALLMSFLASLIPALKAVRMEPVRSLRSD